jgi:hypothetical protein
MTEECDSCGREVTKYVLLDVTEVEDVGNYCSEIRSYYTTIFAEVYSRRAELKKEQPLISNRCIHWAKLHF